MKILLKNALVLDRSHDCVPLDVEVENDCITRVGEGLEVGQAQVLDLSGCILMPGIIDAHVHVANDQVNCTLHPELLEGWAMHGVTTVRDLGVLYDLDEKDFMQWKRQQNKPSQTQFVTSGKFIDCPGGYGAVHPFGFHIGVVIEDETQAAAAVDRLRNAGCDGLKLAVDSDRPMMTPAMFKAVCDRAREHDMWVGVHIGESDYMDMLTEAGITDASHCPHDKPIPQEVMEKMLVKGVAIVHTGEGVARDTPKPRPKNLPPPPPPKLDENGKPISGMPPPLREDPVTIANLIGYHKMGGIVALGTDFMDQNKPCPPVPLFNDLLLLGLSVQEIITMATYNGARVCRLEKQLGAVEAGLLANLIAVPGRIEGSFEKLTAPAFVMNRGVILKNELA